ncbi:MAG: Lrp/AsnC family transcriptional regulator [Rhizobiales bacterium]|nr:Lrp/AsnC family transcriptional regulator [Hyphomicrobiales bacterium]NRB14350.1 Lrp/AsnC family transcriptional regulator [Hyphomicrobiales bacterium]
MESSNIDKIDRLILKQLLANSRITNQELSERVGLSPSPCFRRVKVLEDKGVITGYSATLNEKAIGLSVAVFMQIKLERQVDSELNRFEEAIAMLPEVADCWLMTGDNDYLLRILVPDLTEYENFLTGTLTKIPGIASIQSSVSLRRIKSSDSKYNL